MTQLNSTQSNLFTIQLNMSTTLEQAISVPSTSSSPPTYSSVLSRPAPTPQQKTPEKIPENYFKTYTSEFPLINPDGTFTLFNWKNTKSALKHKPFIGRTPPDTNSPNTLFLDRKSNPRISDKDLLSCFRNDLLGIAFDPANSFLQLTFKDTDTFNHYLSLPSIKINDKEIHLTPPKSFPKSTLVIHLHGLPILQPTTISSSIDQALSPYCDIKEIAPVLLNDTELLTPKWDAVVTPISGKQIPVHLQILDSSVALTWADSSPICLRCHNTNHKSQNCPLRPTPCPRPSQSYAAQISRNNNNKSVQKVNSSAIHSDDDLIDKSNDATNNFNSTNTSLQNSMHAPPVAMDTDTNTNMTTSSSTNTTDQNSHLHNNNSNEDVVKHNSPMDIESSNNDNHPSETATSHCSNRIAKTPNYNAHSNSSTPYTTTRHK